MTFFWQAKTKTEQPTPAHGLDVDREKDGIDANDIESNQMDPGRLVALHRF